MSVPVYISIISVIISVFSFISATYFSKKNSNKADAQEIENRVAENTKMNMKLDEINRNTTDIKYDISAIKKDVQKHSEKIVELESSTKQAHHRIDELSGRMNTWEDNNHHGE